MRSAANPRRNADSFARMLAAVAAASLATISGAPATKPTTLDMMQSHQKPPAALALARGDSSVMRCVIVVAVVPMLVSPIRVIETFDRHKPNESARPGRQGFHVYASDQQVERERHFTEYDRLNDAEGSIVVSWKHQRDHTEDQPAEGGND